MPPNSTWRGIVLKLREFDASSFRATLIAMIGVLLMGLAGAIGAVAGGGSAALLHQAHRTPIIATALGAIAFAILFNAQFHVPPVLLIPLTLKSLLGAGVLPVVHQALRASFSK